MADIPRTPLVAPRDELKKKAQAELIHASTFIGTPAPILDPRPPQEAPHGGFLLMGAICC